MKHILTDEQKEEFLNRMGVVYRGYKKINSDNWSNETSYREGIIDFCDSLIFVSSEITYEISSLRNEIEYLFDEIDNEK